MAYKKLSYTPTGTQLKQFNSQTDINNSQSSTEAEYMGLEDYKINGVNDKGINSNKVNIIYRFIDLVSKYKYFSLAIFLNIIWWAGRIYFKSKSGIQ